MTITYPIGHHIGMKARRKGSISYAILSILEKSVDGFVRVQDFRQHSLLYMNERHLKKSELARAIKRLRDSGVIEEVRVKDDLIFKLTDNSFGLVDIETEAWDNKWRIVIWDIPEQKRIVRNLFRRNLKKWGFKPLQKSVWVSKKNVYDKLLNYIKDLGIEQWVTVIEADKLSQ